ncbi:MAG TPA: group I intron-associated PD-(D/E)XK endonuclease [Terriglobales bacterium]|nr:group I intron-associated PD-(D/E)XK endonuclease [Terriglobales bacterium]
MKKKSNIESSKLKRGPGGNCITRKQQGEIIEVAFLHKAIELGFSAAKPYGDCEAYDFLLDSGCRMWRVQVKSSYSKRNSSYFINATRNRAVARPYTADEIDFLVAYTTPDEAWYVIPAEALGDHNTICLHPHRKNSTGLFERFREAWCLMACPRNPKLRPGLVIRPMCGSCAACASGCGCPLMRKSGDKGCSKAEAASNPG